MPNFIALYVGTPSDGPPPDMTPDVMRDGMLAWGAWMQKHADSIVFEGGPCGRTKSVSKSGIADIRNGVGGFVVVKADSAEEAAKMFEGHPHFSIFPGEAVEVMPVLDIPTMPD